MLLRYETLLLVSTWICLTYSKPTNDEKEGTKKLTSDEKYQKEKLTLEEKLRKHEERIKEIKEELKDKAKRKEERRIKKLGPHTKHFLEYEEDPDYFLRQRSPTSQELREHNEAQKKVEAEKQEIYYDHVKWPTYGSSEFDHPENFEGTDESKGLTFFEKYKYPYLKDPPDPTTLDSEFDWTIHPFDNPDHPHYQNPDVATATYYKYNSEEIDYYNKKYNYTLRKDMFTPPQPFVTGLNLSDWYNFATLRHVVKVFNYPMNYNTLKANYMKYVFTPLYKLNTMYENCSTTPEGFYPYITDFPDQDVLGERIAKNMEIPFYEDHVKNSTWCFICGDTFSHPTDRRWHVTNKHFVYGDYGKDRLSDPNWDWKENIQIYRRPTLFPRSYESYVDEDHLTMDISFDHYEYWNLKRNAGEITFPNRPETRNLTKRLPNRKDYLKLKEELKHFIWWPPKNKAQPPS